MEVLFVSRKSLSYQRNAFAPKCEPLHRPSRLTFQALNCVAERGYPDNGWGKSRSRLGL
jgi:hypothetical protein